MVNQGLLVRLEAKPGKDADVQDFLKSALPAVRREAGTSAWFAIRFGRGEYGIFDVFLLSLASADCSIMRCRGAMKLHGAFAWGSPHSTYRISIYRRPAAA